MAGQKLKKSSKKRALKNGHYGKRLADHLESHGISKKFACYKLGLSRPWLDEMILTGNFTEENLKKVKQFIKK